MFQNKLNYKIINLAAFVILLYVLVNSISLWWGIIANILSIFSPFIIGFAFAYAFTPLVKTLENLGLTKSLSITTVILLIVILLALILGITLPMLYDQLSLFIKSTIEIIENLDAKFNINLGNYEIKVMDYLNDILKEVGTYASSTGMDIINKSIGFLGKFIVGFVGFIYFLIDMDKIRETLKEWLQAGNKRAFEYFQLMDNEITNYLKGLEIFMLIQLIEYSFLFLVIGHPNWMILGLLACITTVIPYFGGLITNIIAIFLASVISPKLVLTTTIICLIFPQLDGYVISPKVYGKTNNVNPLITIMAVSVGGTIAGVIGIIASLPCYLLIRTTYHFFKNDLKKGMVMMKKTI